MTVNDLPLAPLERALCEALLRVAPDTDLTVLACCALCSQALLRGDVCLMLSSVAGRTPWPECRFSLPHTPELYAKLNASVLIGDGQGYAPFVLCNERLYLARYAAYEEDLAKRLLARTSALDIDQDALKQSLSKLFAGNSQVPDWQRLAAAQAVRNRLTVISGGPGTGKTTTVVRLLAALLEQPKHTQLAIGLAAPTGKAAARMAEAIRNAKALLPVSEAVKDQLPEQARTLHRLLGAHGDSPKVRYNAQNPLALDVLVIDEASMIDLAIMAKVVEALTAHARLILLGDKDQLSAVEAGAVFAELCAEQGFDTATANALTELTGHAVQSRNAASQLASQVLLLTHSHRFKSDSGIGHLARVINAGDVKGTQQVLAMDYPDLTYHAHPTPASLHERLYQGYAPYLKAALTGDPALAFAAFNAFRLLTAQREGPWGVNQLNDALEQRLHHQRQHFGRWYAGRAVMVTQNDYGLGLFNGDIGLCLKTPDGLRVFFEADAGFRSFSTARLPAHEPAFAMTVHKSQGSEFAHVVLVLPDQPSPLLSRSLLYTGITRAKTKVEIWAHHERLTEAVRSQAIRAAGLSLRLRPERQAPLPWDVDETTGQLAMF